MIAMRPQSGGAEGVIDGREHDAQIVSTFSVGVDFC
jgi:hypothetical protein